MEPTTISVVIPALNEEATIGRVVREMQSSQLVSEVIVTVDPRTDDQTSTVASKASARVVHGEKHGFGATIKAGVRCAVNRWIFKIDGDIPNCEHEWIEKAAALRCENTSLIKSFWQTPNKPRAVTWLAAKPAIRIFCPTLEFVRLPLSGIYLFDKAAVPIERVVDDWAFDLNLLVDIHLHGLGVRQFEIPEIRDRTKTIEERSPMAEEIIDFMLNKFRPKRSSDAILLIMAHPDDAEIWCGGAVASHCFRGGRARAVHLFSNPEREEEGRASARLLPRYEHAYLGNDIFSQPALPSVTRAIADHIHDFEPDVVITHPPNDFHPDHSYTNKATRAGLLALAQVNYPEYVYMCNTYHERGFSPASMEFDTYVDISEVYELKRSMISRYKSQKTEYYLEMVDCMDALNGFRAGVKRAEAFATMTSHLANTAQLGL